jgi:ATP-dependent RNA helicase DeaD
LRNSIVALSNKIKDTEVDHEIDTYLPAINSVLEDLSKEELIKKCMRLNSIVLSITRKTETFQSNFRVKDVNVMTEMVLQEKTTMVCNEIFVNIGSRDNFDWMSLKIT